MIMPLQTQSSQFRSQFRLRRKCSNLITYILAINLLVALILEICCIGASAAHNANGLNSHQYEDNEFAEFEENDEELANSNAQQHHQQQQQQNNERIDDNRNGINKESDENDATVEEEDDDEEFETVSDSDGDDTAERVPLNARKSTGSEPDLKITKVPLHLRSNWESYYLEFVMIAGLIVYFINFITGRNKNHRMAHTWFDVHKELLESNFALVGDDFKKEIENAGLVKETESVFTLWCSGRVCVEGMLVELRFLKRQDLVNVISSYIKPSVDQIIIKVYLNADAMDSYVFCIANKKTAPKLAKEMNDINTFCPEKKSAEKYGVSGNKYVLLNEIGEVASVLLDAKVISLLKKHEDCIDYIHFSDQFSGFKLSDDSQPIKLPEVKKVLIFSFNFPANCSRNIEEIEKMKPLLQLVFYSIEKVKRFRLSREGKIKAEKNRQRVEEMFLKTTHAQRQEVAQMKREERKRAEKEKILNEEDPDKQRKWEEKEYRRELKKKAPKMKQLKVKAM